MCVRRAAVEVLKQPYPLKFKRRTSFWELFCSDLLPQGDSRPKSLWWDLMFQCVFNRISNMLSSICTALADIYIEYAFIYWGWGGLLVLIPHPIWVNVVLFLFFLMCSDDQFYCLSATFAVCGSEPESFRQFHIWQICTISAFSFMSTYLWYKSDSFLLCKCPSNWVSSCICGYKC